MQHFRSLFFIVLIFIFYFFFFQAEDGIRDVERSRGLGDVYKRQGYWGDIVISPYFAFGTEVDSEPEKEKLFKRGFDHQLFNALIVAEFNLLYYLYKLNDFEHYHYPFEEKPVPPSKEETKKKKKKKKKKPPVPPPQTIQDRQRLPPLKKQINKSIQKKKKKQRKTQQNQREIHKPE
eukprot:TRINITY_DN29965_c0_g1_i2.p3 TRINITY_DN29965_c0_g1~~TRINITY_DN29965_c0_g1_i2.p3  ORF type:complete len:177 (-),score=39.13 TRINITY_DN29965_c0_g1_i2:60-590(-)